MIVIKSHIIFIAVKDELLQTQMYRKSMQRCFKKIKDNIDIVSMTAKAVKAELVRKEDLSWFKTDKRKKKADLFLTKIIQTIELKNIPKFEEIIGKYIADEIDKCRYDIPSRQGNINTIVSNKSN
ncbi:unnamed protein product [Mytilus edulis]|uniref:Uncharacterized protein n=1 Tax=Mytilus edulis TaxID=6550 RepID=A0A8S3V2H1_MYTED|nr:unnamed protein product [Mytilus edulis]